MPAGHDLALALRAAYLALHRRTDDVLAACGVTADQFVLMAVLAEGAALTQRDLARRAASDPNTVRAMLLILERRKLITRPPHPTDSRARRVALTANGQRVYKRLWATSRAVRVELVAALRPAEVQPLLGLLGRVTLALGGAAETTEPTEPETGTGAKNRSRPHRRVRTRPAIGPAPREETP
ncbi:MarR family winged helix-turn-helix transcriptional regulator [Frigoriglobus tundricola]|uniref:Transcriptional regulator, MarR family n=1 Tax=Frigoriglobus tundricola TaxID=2774151 RepID=A0A6M5Z1K2_9BACT|nr:MarR family transcriptional regulator [Frigoriglobus tundricola]QJW99052.1 Transcriptional regulator, MarR family [Frigoriglobus tundricola]